MLPLICAPAALEALILTDVLIVLSLILLNGLFSGAEIAIISMRKTRLRELVDQGMHKAQAVQYLREHPERFLATVQVGITVVGATAAAFGGDIFAEPLASLLGRVSWLAPHARGLALAIVVGTVSYLSLVLGELVPKSLALRHAEAYALLAGKPLRWLSWIARPVVWLLTASSNVVLRLFGDRTSFTEARLSPDEIQEMVDEAARAGTLDPRTSEIASRALEFRDLNVAEVMVPRVDIAALPKGATGDELRHVLTRKLYSRLPVYEGGLENVVGYVAVKDLLGQALKGEPISIAGTLRPALFVPESMRAADLLQDLQRRRVPMAMVVDEQGGLVGLVTVEDLVEEVMGEIFSEQDRSPDPIRSEDGGCVIVQGTTAIRDVNRELELELPEGDSWSTIAGLAIALAGRIPEQGERYQTQDGTELEIVEASPRRVRVVRVRPAPPSPAPKAEPGS